MAKIAVLLFALGMVLASARTINQRSIGHDASELQTLRERLPQEKHESLDHFVGFMKKFNKQYTSLEEAHNRLSIFHDNLQSLHESQAREGGTAVRGVTRFFDMTREEFKQKFTGLKLTHPKRVDRKHNLTPAQFQEFRTFDAPDSVDWRTKGAVTDVKDQQSCGSCYVFSSVAAIEGQWYLKTGDLFSLSEELALDCGDDGQCDGGDPLHVYDTFAEIGGIETEKDYPYEAFWGKTGKCRANPKKFVAYVNGSYALPIHDEDFLANVVSKNGPVEVNIDADDLFDYDSGILVPKHQKSGSHPEKVNHAVLAVGYGEEKGQKFWIIRNSWGKYWGEKGYFRVARGVNALFIADTNPSLPLIL